MIPYLKRNPMKEYKVVIYQENQLSSLVFGAAKVNPVKFSAFLNSQTSEGWRVVTMKKTGAVCCCFLCVKPISSSWSGNVFKLGVYACLGLFVGWVLLLILQLWFSFIEAELFIKITLTMAGLFVIILAALLVFGQYFSEKKMKDDGFIN